jgi:formate hydrogenlyase transcriptional activator
MNDKNIYATISSDGGGNLPELDEVIRRHIIDVLEATGWRVRGDRGAAKILGLKPTTLDSKMKRLDIKRNKIEDSSYGDKS